MGVASRVQDRRRGTLAAWDASFRAFFGGSRLRRCAPALAC
jgi:hypothetical protein